MKRKASNSSDQRNSKKRKTDQDEGAIADKPNQITAEVFDLARLPSEILGDYVFKYFSLHYWLQSLILVNKQWYQAAIHPNSDKQLLVNTQLPQNMFKFFTIASKYKITTLAVTGALVSKRRLTALLNSSPRLNTFVQFSSAGNTRDTYAGLKTFEFIKTVLIESNMLDLFPNATRVQFSENIVNWKSTKEYPNVTELAIISTCTLGQLLRSFPSLKVLHVDTLSALSQVPKAIEVRISSTADQNWRKHYSYDQVWASKDLKTPLFEVINTPSSRAAQLKGLMKYTSIDYEISLQDRCNEYKFPAVAPNASCIAVRKKITFPELAARFATTAQWRLLLYHQYFPAIDGLAMILGVDEKENIEEFVRKNSQELAETMTVSVFVSLVGMFEASIMHEIFTKEQLQLMIALTDESGGIVHNIIEAKTPQYFQELVDEYGPLPTDWLAVKADTYMTPIQHALSLMKLDWIEYLLDFGAKVDIAELFGDLKGDSIDIKGVQKIVHMIIEKNAASTTNVNWFFDPDWFKLACNEKILMLDFFVSLLKIDDLNQVRQEDEDNEELDTSLFNFMIASWEASSQVLEHVVKKYKIDLNLADDNDMTPVLTAIDMHRLDLMEWLLANGAEHSPATGIQPLYYAVGERKLESEETVEYIDCLLAFGADINAYSSDDRCGMKTTALMNAIESGQSVQIIEYLIARGARVDLTAGNGNTVMHAAVHSKPEVIAYLAPRADINKLNHEGVSALDLALTTPSGKEALVMLLKCGADCNQPRPGFNMTPLMLACLRSNFEAVQELLKYQVNLHAVDVSGRSFVYYHVKHFREDNVYFDQDWFAENASHLLTAENTQFIVNEAKKIIELAQKDSLLSVNLFRLCTSYLFIAEFMLDHVGFDVNAQDTNGNVLMSYPMPRHEVHSFLLSKNPNLNIQNNDGDTPLMLAVQRNEPRWFLKKLIEGGADISIKNNCGVSVSSIMPDILIKLHEESGTIN